MEAVSRVAKDGIVVLLLIGHKEQIKEQLILLGESASNFTIIHTESAEEAAYKAAELGSTT